MTVINLYNWTLYGNDVLRLSGICDNHPRLGRLKEIGYTSRIVRAWIDGDYLMAQTRNSLYRCKLNQMRLHGDVLYDELEKAIEKLSEVYSSEVISIVKSEINMFNELLGDKGKEYLQYRTLNSVGICDNRENKELDKLKKVVYSEIMKRIENKDNTLYIDMDNATIGLCVYNVQGNVGSIDPQIHIGMIQDSVLYLKSDLVDFRYFPSGFENKIETYSWSDNILHLIVKNSMREGLYFNEQLIEPGEEKEISRETHSRIQEV